MSSEHVTLLHVADVPAVSALDGSKKDGSNVSCLVLPPRLKWPTYSQDRALAFRVIVLKSSPLTVLSSHGPTSILQLLLEGNQVALIGHPGIGKVADMNALWPDLFQALRAKKITTLFYRLGTVLYQFTYERESVHCAVVKQAGNTLDSLAEFFADTPKNVILVLEREDDEVDPVFQVPTVVTASLCDEYYGLKTWGKCGRLRHCDRPPHTFEELCVLCAAYYQEDRPIFLENLDLSYAHTLADAQAEIESRISFVGPLARVVLGSERTYRLHKNAMRDALNTHEFLQYVGSHDSTYLPKYANYFLAPDANGKLAVLSPYAEELMLESAKDHNKECVARRKYPPNLAAAHVVKKFCLLDQGKNGTQVCDAWNFNKWEYYHNPGPGAALQPAHALNESERAELISDLTRYKREAHFASSILHRSFDQLDENCVYSSTLDNVLVGRFFMINKEQKRLTLFSQAVPLAPPKSLSSV